MRLKRALPNVFDFSESRQALGVRRRPVLAIGTSAAIHGAAVGLALALTFSSGFIERPHPLRATVLLTPPPVFHASPQVALRRDRIPPRVFRAPVTVRIAAPLREPARVATLQIPLLEVAQPLLPPVELTQLPAAPAPPLRTDNFAAAAKFADNRAAAAVVSSGFEQMAPEHPHRASVLALSGEGFGDATMLPAIQIHHAGLAAALPVTRSVEILAKPRPAYTEDARRQRIEGEVLLEVLFTASGQARVLRTVRGLGHGLDESAIAAAEAIRFRPAERAGVTADSTAIVHIVFQLAY
jgi:TonB family protein